MTDPEHSENQPTRTRVKLTDISSRAWEHPADRGALVALRKLRGFDMVVRKLSGLINERTVKFLLVGNTVRVSEKQFPRIHRLYQEVGESLDCPQLPELFVQASPTFNAICIGMDEPRILLNSALIDLLDDEEMRCVLGHELGHALSGHALYRTLLTYLITFGSALMPFRIGMIGVRAIQALLMEWARKAELSGDRAGLLAAQDPQAAIRVEMKLASGGHLADLDEEAFLEQAREHDATENIYDSLLKFMLVEDTTHPFNVVRAWELRKWVDSGEYANILAGEYPRRSEDASAKISQEAAAAADSYTTAIRNSQDSAAKLLRDLGDGVSDFTSWLGSKFNQPGGPGPNDPGTPGPGDDWPRQGDPGPNGPQDPRPGNGGDQPPSPPQG